MTHSYSKSDLQRLPHLDHPTNQSLPALVTQEGLKLRRRRLHVLGSSDPHLLESITDSLQGGKAPHPVIMALLDRVTNSGCSNVSVGRDAT